VLLFVYEYPSEEFMYVAAFQYFHFIVELIGGIPPGFSAEYFQNFILHYLDLFLGQLDCNSHRFQFHT
jgi:hypothetical protein